MVFRDQLRGDVNSPPDACLVCFEAEAASWDLVAADLSGSDYFKFKSHDDS